MNATSPLKSKPPFLPLRSSNRRNRKNRRLEPSPPRLQPQGPNRAQRLHQCPLPPRIRILKFQNLHLNQIRPRLRKQRKLQELQNLRKRPEMRRTHKGEQKLLRLLKLRNLRAPHSHPGWRRAANCVRVMFLCQKQCGPLLGFKHLSMSVSSTQAGGLKTQHQWTSGIRHMSYPAAVSHQRSTVPCCSLRAKLSTNTR